MRNNHLLNPSMMISLYKRPAAVLTTAITAGFAALSAAGCAHSTNAATTFPSRATTTHYAQPGPEVTPHTISPSALPAHSRLPSQAATAPCRHNNPTVEYTGLEPPQAICVHIGAHITITLRSTSLGPWLPPTTSAPAVATLETPPTSPQTQMRMHLTAHTSGTATLTTQTQYSQGVGAPTALWQLTIRVIS